LYLYLAVHLRALRTITLATPSATLETGAVADTDSLQVSACLANTGAAVKRLGKRGGGLSVKRRKWKRGTRIKLKRYTKNLSNLAGTK
jgi:hypothetical protein